MALQLSNTIKNKGLNNVFRPSKLYVMVPAVDLLEPSAALPSAEITFNNANNGQISLAAPVQLAVPSGTIINRLYIATSPLTNLTISQQLVRIELTGDDVETYDNNGVYIINTINVTINT